MTPEEAANKFSIEALEAALLIKNREGCDRTNGKSP